MSAHPKRVVFCADDFGQSRAIDAGILRLVEQRRLSAVSCLVQGPVWAEDAPRLLQHSADVDIGLHFNLAQSFRGNHAMQHVALIARSYLGTLDRPALEREFGEQLDAFERATGRAPDFVDGHQHVHQLPIVRDALLEVVAGRYAPLPYVRSTVPRRFRGLKALVVASLGGYALKRELRSRGVPHNADFAGVYRLQPDQGYPRRMARWLADISDGGMIVCHPGERDVASDDPIAAARASEFRHIASPEFQAACRAASVTPARFATGRK